MCGEATDKETIARLDYTLENQLQDQFEVKLYKSNSKYERISAYMRIRIFFLSHSQSIVQKLIVTIILSQ